MKWFGELLVVFYPPEVPNHHTLKAWQHAERLAVECSRAAQRFPDFEQERLADQLRRASYSIPLNIAEGSAKALGTTESFWIRRGDPSPKCKPRSSWRVTSVICAPLSLAGSRPSQRRLARHCLVCVERSVRRPIVPNPVDGGPRCVCGLAFAGPRFVVSPNVLRL